jgi:hypothetical protein
MTMQQAMPRAEGRPRGHLAVSTTGLTKRFGDRTVVYVVVAVIAAMTVFLRDDVTA